MSKNQWEWGPASSERAYKGTGPLGTCIIIWEPTYWSVLVFPPGFPSPLEGRKRIPLEKGWDTALREAEAWATEMLAPFRKEEAEEEPESPLWWEKAEDWLRDRAREVRAALFE